MKFVLGSMSRALIALTFGGIPDASDALNRVRKNIAAQPQAKSLQCGTSVPRVQTHSGTNRKRKAKRFARVMGRRMRAGR
jgi:hypothetical protein